MNMKGLSTRFLKVQGAAHFQNIGSPCRCVNLFHYLKFLDVMKNEWYKGCLYQSKESVELFDFSTSM